jgi:hypothetical protein
MYLYVLGTLCNTLSGCTPAAGDVFAALRLSGALRDITRRGARCIEVHSLEDNLLARPADPVFLGERVGETQLLGGLPGLVTDACLPARAHVHGMGQGSLVSHHEWDPHPSSQV